MRNTVVFLCQLRQLALLACLMVVASELSAQPVPSSTALTLTTTQLTAAMTQTMALPPADGVPVASPELVASQAATVTSTVALKRPGLVDVDKINAADTGWLLTSTALVLLMTLPGIALFYAGMVRKKNVINTLACVVAVAAIVTVVWFALGYSLSFTPGSGFLGSLDRALFDGFGYLKEKGKVAVSHAAPNVPESVYAMFQLTFAIITTALVVGSMVERMKFSALVLFAFIWPVAVYAPIAHWVWEPGGWLLQLGVLDFAGGSVVHINAGVAGLVLAYFLGPRRGYGKEPFEPFNLALTMAGTGLLWVGWFGFNAGSAIAADGRAGLAMLVTQLAAATAALTWGAMEWLNKGTCSLLGLCSGAVAGLVAITPASGYVTPASAVLIGLAAGVVCYWGATQLKRWLRVDDSLDVFGIHAMGGLTGALLTGVFNDPHISGSVASFPLQLLGSVAVAAYSFVVTGLLLFVVSMTVGLRVSEADEIQGLDISAHRERIGT
jgi:ammonium transporter, Amt family